MMIDPADLEVFAQPFPSRRFGHHHRAGFAYGEYIQFARRRFVIKDHAERYGLKLQKRWARLWAAKVNYLREQERITEHAF